MPVPPRLLHLVGQASRAPAVWEFARASRDVEGTQTARLLDILGRNAQTEHGRRHGFADIRTPRQYAERVPLVTADDIAPLVQRTMNGERGILTAEPPVYYARTTGTAGTIKHIPVTASYRAEFQKTVHVSLWHLFRRFPRAFRGRALYFVGSRRAARTPDGLDAGTMSGFNFTQMPPLVRALYAWPYELFEVKDLETRTILALLLATYGDPTLLVGIFPAAVVHLLRDLGRLAPDLARFARDGRLPDTLRLSPGERAFFAARCPPSAETARRLERAAAAPDEEKALEAWPSLSLVYCWTGSTAASYLPELQRRLGGGRIPVRDAVYSASEGWCNVPLGDPEPGGPLCITSHYYEFIEEAAFDRGERLACTATELQQGSRYQIVLTNSGGLYRYVLNDIVEVYALRGRVPCIRFARKGGASTNLAGEAMDEGHVNAAVAKVLALRGLEATFFALVPSTQPRLRYRLYLEPAPQSAARAQALATLGDEIDRALCEANYGLGRVRASEVIGPVEAVLVPQGTWDAVRRRRIAEGGAEAQIKTAHLLPDEGKLPPEVLAAAGGAVEKAG